MSPSTGEATPLIDPRFCGYRLRVSPSPAHRWGVFALEAIPAGRHVIEYTGEWVLQIEWRRYRHRDILYLAEYDDEWMVDGATGGSGAEYINHSCDPNLEVRKQDRHLLLFSKRPIAEGDELGYDYRLAPDARRIVCKCGSPVCRGLLNSRE